MMRLTVSLAVATLCAQGQAASNSSDRSLLSQRDSAPKMLSEYCGWSTNKKDHACRLTFSGSKLHLQWKKKGDSKPPSDCPLCGKSRNVDCKSEGYKVTGGSAEDGYGVASDGYDVQLTDTGSSSDCLRKALGESKKSPNHVPIRIKIHSGNTHLDLIEAKKQDDRTPDGPSCDLLASCEADSGFTDCRDCSTWDDDHTACRRRAGCKSLGLPVPDDEIEDSETEVYETDEYHIEDDEQYDIDNFETEVV